MKLSSHSEHHSCIAAFTLCHDLCLQMALNHGSPTGGDIIVGKHFLSLIGCAEICQTFANFQLNNAQFQERLCLICAEACEACAVACENIAGMRKCVRACRKCAEHCQRMMGVWHSIPSAPQSNQQPNFNNWLVVALKP